MSEKKREQQQKKMKEEKAMTPSRLCAFEAKMVIFFPLPS